MISASFIIHTRPPLPNATQEDLSPCPASYWADPITPGRIPESDRFVTGLRISGGRHARRRSRTRGVWNTTDRKPWRTDRRHGDGAGRTHRVAAFIPAGVAPGPYEPPRRPFSAGNRRPGAALPGFSLVGGVGSPGTRPPGGTCRSLSHELVIGCEMDIARSAANNGSGPADGRRDYFWPVS